METGNRWPTEEEGKEAVRAPCPAAPEAEREGISILQRREVTFENVANQSKVTQLGRGQASLSPLFSGRRALVGVGVRCTLFWSWGYA